MGSLQGEPTKYRLGNGFRSSKRRLIKESIMSTPVVLITDGLTGISRAAAVAFAKTGAKVVVAGRRDGRQGARISAAPAQSRRVTEPANKSTQTMSLMPTLMMPLLLTLKLVRLPTILLLL